MHERQLVYRAGVIPYLLENNEIVMMFMKPSNSVYGGDAFQIAKGRVEEGESMREAALREAGEELGLFTGNIIRLEDLGTFLGRTTIFVAKVKTKDLFYEPSFETADVAWLTMSEFEAIGRDLHKSVVRTAYQRILAMEEESNEVV